MKYYFIFLFIQYLTPLFAQEKTSKPNIVFILADDLGYGDLGAYGQKRIATPHIDRLAQQGVRFVNFYAGTSVCAPSRSSLLTGQHTGHTPIRGNKELEPEGQQPLPDSAQTIAKLFQDNGYMTGAFGKWGLGMVGSTGAPNIKGFDEFYGYLCQRQSHRYYPTHLWHNHKKIELSGNDLLSKVHYAPDLIQEKTLAFIDQHQDKPFFLFVPTVLPHAELAGPQDEYYEQYAQAFEENPFIGNDYGTNATIAGYASVDKPRATFASMVTRMDAYVGEILSKLDTLGLSENTIVIFSSDNGSHREGGADPDFFNSSGGLRGNKRSLYEGGIRVPMIVKWPSKIPSNSTSDHLGAFWDFLPTFAQLINVDKISYTDGISMLPTLLGQGKQAQHSYLYWEFHEDGGRQAIRMGDYKLIKQKVKNPAQSYYELYNLKKDPTELVNLAQKEEEILQTMISLMDRVRVENPDFPLINTNKT